MSDNNESQQTEEPTISSKEKGVVNLMLVAAILLAMFSIFTSTKEFFLYPSEVLGYDTFLARTAIPVSCMIAFFACVVVPLLWNDRTLEYELKIEMRKLLMTGAFFALSVVLLSITWLYSLLLSYSGLVG